MSKYATEGIEVQDGFVSNRFPPQSVQLASVVNITQITSATKGTPGIKMVIMGPEIEGLTEHDYGKGQYIEEQMWTSDSAWEWTKKRIIYIADRMVEAGYFERVKFDAAMSKVTNDEQLVDTLQKIFQNKKLAWIIAGNVNYKKDEETGKVTPRTYSGLPFFDFCKPPAQYETLVNKMKDAVGKDPNHLITDNGIPPELAAANSEDGEDDEDW